jgi:HK97 family phage prohead protease
VSALLERTAAFELRADEQGGDGLTLDGIAATFGQPTEIDSWEGSFSEQIRKGAFRKTLRENTPVMQFDHGRHPLVGSIPIGAITDLRETDEGLAVQARLSDNWLIQPVRDAITEGSISGMSFRFSVLQEEWHDVNGKRVRPEELDQLLWNPGERGPLMRTLKEVKLHELGPVVFPAYASTSVGVRAASLAAEIRSDDDLRHEVRAALALQAPKPPADDLDDPATRREVARALLFGSTPETTGAPPANGHVAATQDRSTEEPSPDGHSEESNDKPPSDGHSSPTEPTTGQEPLRSEISERVAFMREHLASIADKDA